MVTPQLPQLEVGESLYWIQKSQIRTVRVIDVFRTRAIVELGIRRVRVPRKFTEDYYLAAQSYLSRQIPEAREKQDLVRLGRHYLKLLKHQVETTHSVSDLKPLVQSLSQVNLHFNGH